MTTSLDETTFKLKEFATWNDASPEARYNADPADIKKLMKGLVIKIIDLNETDMELEFDIINIGAPIVNALRRILIAEIPTMAIDRVHMYNNTTIIPDEVLSHRLGMIPIKVDPRPFVFKDADGEDTEEDTLKFELKVKCSRKPNVPKDIPISEEQSCVNSKVFSEHLKFIPLGKQKDLYGNIRPIKEDILLAKLRPGQEIDLEAFCVKNIGREHSKFSPVAVASYRLMPQLILHQEITDDKAHTLAKVFPGAVKVSKRKDREVAKIVNQRKIMCNRNIFFYDELKDLVELTKVKDHYIFTVESAGAVLPDILVLEAIDVLKDKCRKFLNALKSMKI